MNRHRRNFFRAAAGGAAMSVMPRLALAET
jgi:hypothetical protein